jgi:hypothetical protein
MRVLWSVHVAVAPVTTTQFSLPVISLSAGHRPQTAVCPTRLLETQQCTLEKLLLTADSSLSVSHPSPPPPAQAWKVIRVALVFSPPRKLDYDT